MRFFTISAISALAAFVSASTQPNYSQSPSGNPIALPSLGEQVPVGKPYTITWQPTTPGTVSLVLLRGPSNNVTPLLTIVQSIQNTGTYVWTPPTTLQNDVTHYGLLLVVDATGQYQYSTQFGISNPNGGSSSSSTCTTSSVSSSSGPSASSVVSSSSGTTSSVTIATTPSSGTPTPSSNASPTVSPAQTPQVSSTLATTGISTVPSTVSNTSPTTSPSKSTSGANHPVVGFGGIIAAAGLAVFLIV